jgi:hypothetical protein
VLPPGQRSAAYMDKVNRKLATTVEPGRGCALKGAAWMFGRWVEAGVLGQTDVEDALYAAVEQNGLSTTMASDQGWATSRWYWRRAAQTDRP